MNFGNGFLNKMINASQSAQNIARLPQMPPASAEKEETVSHIFWYNDSLKSSVQICNI